jgi:hypothetical protein
MRPVLSILFAAAAWIAADAAASAQVPGSKHDARVAGAMRSARGMTISARQLVAEASTATPGSTRWFSLMNRACREHRLAINRLARFRGVKVSRELRTHYQRMRDEALARAIRVYESVVSRYVAVGSPRMALRQLAELSRFAPEAAARIKRELLAPSRISRPASETAGVDERVPKHPRTRAGRRLTGEECRWLGRRGYRWDHRAPGRPERAAPRCPRR